MRALLVVCVLVMAACGDDEPTPEPRDGSDTRLVVQVWPRGDSGPVERRVVTRLPRGIGTEQFEPVPRDAACAAIYGGPAVAEVSGTLEGRQIHARFNRTNACEIARWERVEALLGRVAP
jgi:hypothetical protein